MTAITTAKMFLFWMTILCLSLVIRGLHFDLKVDDDERCFLEELEDFDSMRGKISKAVSPLCVSPMYTAGEG